MIGVRKSDAMHHHTRATGDSIVRHKMCVTITNVHRGNVAPIFLRRASFRSDKRHGRYHQDDERQNMSHSCKSEKTHTSRTLSWLKKRDCQQRSRIHFVTIIKPLRCWFFLTFQRWNIAPSDKWWVSLRPDMRHLPKGSPERSRFLSKTKLKCNDVHYPVSQEPWLEKFEQPIQFHRESSSFKYYELRSVVASVVPATFKMVAAT
ncbi:hypothetical protein BXY70_2570 [Roseovarius halotolerans]|jgi:hypothetical protein|uniref:Uncharacterized protein n=1 Tax=Roseovarius halotolerans TaxID=505353 RepID=A0A1X6ZBE6_9RHOB|nr:hypothetical protein BXY70_2570 [Roseovarius halotolerans]SLN46269.1 hypothetical protein ROH8110_02467 [Roseovarius halotolerans]